MTASPYQDPDAYQHSANPVKQFANSNKILHYGGDDAPYYLPPTRKPEGGTDDYSRHTRPSGRGDADIVLRCSEIDRTLPSDSSARTSLTPMKRHVLTRIAAYLTGQTKSVVDGASPDESKAIVKELKFMLSGCLSKEDSRYHVDPAYNRGQTTVGRIVHTGSLELLGDPNLDLRDENVIPSPSGYGISKDWPGVVIEDLPEHGGFRRQRLSTKGGQGLTKRALQRDYHSLYSVRVVGEGRVPSDLHTDERMNPLRINDYKKPDDWNDSVLTSIIDFVSYRQPCSWRDAHMNQGDFSRMFQMRLNETFAYGQALAASAGKRLSMQCPRVTFVDSAKRPRDPDETSQNTARLKHQRLDTSDNSGNHQQGVEVGPRTEAATQLSGMKMVDSTALGEPDHYIADHTEPGAFFAGVNVSQNDTRDDEQNGRDLRRLQRDRNAHIPGAHPGRNPRVSDKTIAGSANGERSSNNGFILGNLTESECTPNKNATSPPMIVPDDQQASAMHDSHSIMKPPRVTTESGEPRDRSRLRDQRDEYRDSRPPRNIGKHMREEATEAKDEIRRVFM